MKIDSPEIDKRHLRQTITAHYGLTLTTITFMPRGEEAFAYLGHAQSGERYFIRLQPAEDAPELASIYAMTTALSQRPHLGFVVAPLMTRHKSAVVPFGTYQLALFPYIEGHTLYQQEPIGADIKQAAMLVAQLHQTRLALPPSSPEMLQRETFGDPFRAPITRALQAAQRTLASQAVLTRHVCRLLLAEQADLWATQQRMDELQRQAHALSIDWVLTHGDPNLDNVLKDAQGQLHLTDWGALAIGPAERDLTHWTGDTFAQFLVHYARVRPHVKLYAGLFEFYFYRWSLQEIADYATRILFKQLGPTENEHAWAELQAYLPVQHEHIAQGVREVQAVIDGVLGAQRPA